VAFLLGLGCTAEAPIIQLGASIPAGEAIPERTVSDHALPAFETTAEKQGKADGNDPRSSHPYYAFTAPPRLDVRMPAEFEDAQALLIAWDDQAWSLESFFLELIAVAHKEIQVVVYLESQQSANLLYDLMGERGIDVDKVSMVSVDLDSVWMRDFGPLVIKDESNAYRIVDFRYYWGRFADDVLPTRIANAWKLDVHRPPIENEGGNFLSDGMGRCISTERVLSRNAPLGHTADTLRAMYREYFGCSSTLFLPELAGEGTGHVDMYATITAPGEVIVGQYTTWDDPENASRLDFAAQTLAQAGYVVRRIPMPMNTDGHFRSYTNALAVNNSVLVPVYRDDTRYEEAALTVFQEAYPDRKVVPIDATEIIRWAGAIHCVTQTVAY
jgi:agmatine/peptidylarginine deiminase